MEAGNQLQATELHPELQPLHEGCCGLFLGPLRLLLTPWALAHLQSGLRLVGSHWPVTYVLWCSPSGPAAVSSAGDRVRISQGDPRQQISVQKAGTAGRSGLLLASSPYSLLFPCLSLFIWRFFPPFPPSDFSLYQSSAFFFPHRWLKLFDYLNDLFQRAEARPLSPTGGQWRLLVGKPRMQAQPRAVKSLVSK